MSELQSLPIDEIVSRGSIRDTEVRQLRQIFYEDGIVSPQEADLLSHLNSACHVQHADWPYFFIEAITDYLVFQERPQGYLTATNAHWLIDNISHDGKVRSKTEFELLVNVLDKARWAPVSLSRFALEQVKQAAITGSGPLRTGKVTAAGTITEGEVDVLRRILYAFGGDGHVAVTRAEADVLFDIDEAVADADPNPAWTDLFVKAIANVMMSASGYAVPSREEALRQEASLENPEQQTSVLASLLSMVQSNLSSIRDAYQDQTAEERALARLEHQRIEIITNEEITEAEASWLASRLGRDGRLSPSEMALIAYLKLESPKIHPALIEAVDRLGRAAA
jgi:hypothetical protein